MCDQDAIRLASYDVIRRDHLDWLEAKSAAGGKEAPDPLGLGALRMVRKRILDCDAHRKVSSVRLLLAAFDEDPVGLEQFAAPWILEFRTERHAAITELSQLAT
jgi:hypothetical protein